MDLRTKIDQALKESLKAGNETRKRTIRLILAGIKLSEVEKGRPLENDAILAVIQKEVKIRKESLEGAQLAGRIDLLEQINAETTILNEFLPEQINDNELEEIVRAAIIEANAANPSDTGKVMKMIMPKLKGRATGDRISQVVHGLLKPSG